MKFSVILPVYNVEKFLTKCLDSILNQDFYDYEIIAVNDGSTDCSPEILKKYQAHTAKLKVINQENRGLGVARNIAIEAAVGDILVFVDSDDYISQKMLSVIARYFDEYNLDILSFDCFFVNPSESFLVEDNEQSAGFSMLSAEEYLTLEPTVWRKAYKRSVFIDNNIRFPERLWYEDLATVCNLAPCVNRIGYLNMKLYYYVQHPNSITHSSNTTRMMEITKAFDIVEAYFKNNGYFEKYYAELEWLCVKHVLYYSAHRFLTKGYYRKQMNILYNYVFSHFPDFVNNKYVIENSPSTYCMNWIINRRFFRFYFKNCIVPGFVNIYKKIIPDK